MNGKGGVYIKQLIDNGALVEDFKTELVGIYPKNECLELEAEFAKTSLYPKGLNGNAGSYIEHTEEVREKISKSARKNNRKRLENGTHHFLGGDIQRKRVEEGTHHFLDGEIARKNARKRVEEGTHNFLGESNPVHKRIENGTHNFLGESNPSHKRVEDGTHNFLGGEISRKTQKKRVENGTHHFLDGEISRKTQKKQVENGSHHFQVKGMVTALNQETRRSPSYIIRTLSFQKRHLFRQHLQSLQRMETTKGNNSCPTHFLNS